MTKLAKAASQLLSQGHQVTIVHGSARPLLNPDGNGADRPSTKVKEWPDDPALMVLGDRLHKCLVASLNRAGVPAIGVCGADGNMVRIRRLRSGSPSNETTLEVAAVDPFWLNVISQNHGVPVMANVATGANDGFHCLCADDLAAACAIGWRADALIFLTSAEGVRNGDGMVLRWLEAGQDANLLSHSAGSRGMLSKLVACNKALRSGVHRARILPVSQTQSLSTFCFERVDYGTEVILPVGAAKV